MVNNPDLALVHAMAAGDERALDELYTRYGGPILGFLSARLSSRQLAEEVLQDVMLAAWRNAATFRGESSVKTWLLAIARNRAINARRGRKFTFTPLQHVFDLQTGDTEPLERVARKDRDTALRDALDRLPVLQREILVLVFFHQLTGPEVAKVLDIPVGTVKSRLHRAKEALRHALDREGGL